MAEPRHKLQKTWLADSCHYGSSGHGGQAPSRLTEAPTSWASIAPPGPLVPQQKQGGTRLLLHVYLLLTTGGRDWLQLPHGPIRHSLEYGLVLRAMHPSVVTTLSSPTPPDSAPPLPIFQILVTL